MNFENGYIYHIYNQGNNRRKIFYTRDNYLFFLKKVKTHFTPYADILAWCLMPNHFHFMVFIKKENSHSDTMTLSHRITNSIHPINNKNTLNNSIAVLLRSYTRAINKQENKSGSLFKAHTKAECVNCPKGLTPSFIIKDSTTIIKSNKSEDQYPNICFNYIHQNPVKANLVYKNTDWEFSSSKDYAGLREGTLVNKNLASEYGFKFI
jgi:putative transposase